MENASTVGQVGRLPILIYDGSCPKCSAIADELIEAGRGRFGILPNQSDEAVNLLDEAFPRGWKKDIYYVERSKGGVRVSQGPRAAWRLMLQVGFLAYWRASQHLKSLSSPPPDLDEGHSGTTRRGALRLVLFGTVFMGLGGLLGSRGGVFPAVENVLARTL